MSKKIAFWAAGLILVASPILVSAQVSTTLTDSCSGNPTIQCLQQEILLLIQILNQLLQRGGGGHDNKLALSFVSGAAPIYTPGQGVHLVMKGQELFDYSTGTPDEGLNVQVYVTDSNGNGNYVAMNASFNNLTSYWEADFNAPTDASKSYKLRAAFYCSNTSLACGQRYTNTPFGSGQVEQSFIFSIGSGYSTGITVTAPNGGEQWQEGVLNTVTWSPYNYNPDINPSKDVTAYLEQKCGPNQDAKCGPEGTFYTRGKVQESGKASIHWITGELNSASQGGIYAPPGGGYYIRVVNNVTGAWDRSDAPFTLLPKPVDLKINGSDGPLNTAAGQSLLASWSAPAEYQYCRLDNAYVDPAGSIYPVPAFQHLTVSGVATIYVPSQGNWYVTIACVAPDGSWQYDSVVTNQAPQSASIQVLSPNGGEQLKTDQTNTITWQANGIQSVSIGLYKNDQWVAWIQKDLPTYGPCDAKGNCTLSWNPSSPTITYGLGDTLNQAIYKIYITGQRIDGQGYVDDKSDSPFSFTATQQPISLTVSASPSTVRNGVDTAVLKWDVSNYPQGAAIEVGLSGAALNAAADATFPYRNIISLYRLDGTTRTVDLAQPGQTSMPAHGTVNFTPNYYSGYLPIFGPVNVTVIDSNNNIVARASAPLQVTAPQPATAACTYTDAYGRASTIQIDGGSSACSSWCSSQSLESGDNSSGAPSPYSKGKYTCAYAGSSISSQTDKNSQLASALSALEAALKSLLANLTH